MVELLRLKIKYCNSYNVDIFEIYMCINKYKYFEQILTVFMIINDLFIYIKYYYKK